MPVTDATRYTERLDRVVHGLDENHLDALICTLPRHVLLVSGYFPVTGTSIAVVTRERRILLIVPEDELELSQRGAADDVITYKPEPLDRLTSITDAALFPMKEAVRRLGLEQMRIGFEFGVVSEPSSYSAMNLFAGSIPVMLRQVAPHAKIQPADKLLSMLSAVKTPREVEDIRLACRIAENAFVTGSRGFRAGISEFEAAVLVRSGFSVLASDFTTDRADGFAWCMSGPNSARAAAAYAQSRARQLAAGDLVLLHANSFANGYWTDITRTYVLGHPDGRQQEIFAAVFAARKAALDAIRPGVHARDVDRAARETLADNGFKREFKHSTGHGVGFSAISANARPRLHPASNEVLEEGMVFNVEPAVYLDGYGGVRHCDMVAVAAKGADVLTPFQCGLNELILLDKAGADLVLTGKQAGQKVEDAFD